MDLGIKGKVAVVLGGSGGLGSAIAHALADEGVKVAVCGRNDVESKSVVQAISARAGYARDFHVDLARVDDAVAQMDRIAREIGPVDILVNNTGGPPAGEIQAVAPEQWRRHFEEMFISITALTQSVLPHMLEQQWGRIITSGSSGLLAPIPHLGISNALRSGLNGWSKTLAREVAARGVTVNMIVPGRIATKRIAQLDAGRAKREGRALDEVVRDSVATIPAARYGNPEEYGAVAAFLASTQASYVTGSTVRVDGGYIPSF